jgi:hypothetical protein
MKISSGVLLLLIGIAAIGFGCGQKAVDTKQSSLPSALSEVPAVRLNYRYEADVPPPEIKNPTVIEPRNEAVQTDFDQNRTPEVLDRTITSPDGKRIVALYHRPNDMQDEYRLDMYSAEGKLLNKVTSDEMAVHFPQTIQWSPDSKMVAFVAMLRDFQPAGDEIGDVKDNKPTPTPTQTPTQTPEIATPEADANAKVETTPPTDAATPEAGATPETPAGILTFRTEQIYVASSEGVGTKPITQNEGLIYFYYVWSPDSRMLAALAATAREWQYLKYQADEAGAIFVPRGRPRIVEPTGRERRLDDGLTTVQPVWSPDSAKVAVAFDKQIRLYDSDGTPPTQAAVPLRNSLLLSSAAYDKAQASSLNADANANTASANTNANTQQQASTLPDERTLVSFNPIVALVWPTDDQLYFQTAAIKLMKLESDNATSFQRWHRLILTPQPQGN